MSEKTIKDIALEVANLVERKNKDYDNSFVKTLEKYGPVAYALRIDDKLSRFESLAVKGNNQLVADESVKDTIKDIIGYSLLMVKWYESQGNNLDGVDWSKVSIDTPVMVRDDDEEEWTFRYFSHYESNQDEPFYAFYDGETSKDCSYTMFWTQCRLATEEEIRLN